MVFIITNEMAYIFVGLSVLIFLSSITYAFYEMYKRVMTLKENIEFNQMEDVIDEV